MNKHIGTVVALALVVIALNMTYTNMHHDTSQAVAPQQAQEKILPVMGRVSMPFDGYGADIGFMVKDGNQLRVVRYDSGTMAANQAFQPRFLSVLEDASGHTTMNPLVLQKFD